MWWKTALAVAVAIGGCRPPSEAELKAEIEKARECTSDAQCEIVGSKCPFGCNIAVNESEAERIREMVLGFESRCVYECGKPGTLSCEEGICTAR